MKGSEIIINALLSENTEVVFGYPGSAVLDLYDSLYAHPEIKHILTADEQGAAHSADGYARASGKTGVCIATSGPGATNLVTGIATAYMDSIPMVCITGNVHSGKLGKDSFQEVDIAGITMPVTKHNFIVRNVKELPVIMRRAFQIAGSGRRGPVLVDVTTDALTADLDIDDFNAVYTENSEKDSLPASIKNYNRYTTEELKRAAGLIKNAKKPLLYVGGGAIGAQTDIKKLAEKIDAFVCDSLMGKGCFDGSDKRYIGMLGTHGTMKARKAVKECDLLIAVGVRFSDRSTEDFENISSKTAIIHIDIDPAEINKNIICTEALIGDAESVLKDLLVQIKNPKKSVWKEDFYVNGPQMIGNCHSVPQKELGKEDKLTDKSIIETIYKLSEGDSVIVTEVGSHQMSTANNYCFSKPRELITSGGLGTMGFGLAASIGAQLACPEKKVFNFAGDGSFRMNMSELATAVRYGVPVIEVIFDNRALGLVQELQDKYFDGRRAYTDIVDKMDFVALAQAMGAEGVKVTTEKELENILIDIFSRKDRSTPVLIDCITR